MKCRKRAVLSFVKKIASDSVPPRIMDLGCGYGWLTKTLSEFGDAIGIDLSVNEAKKRYPEIKFQEANILCDEIEGSYDIIVSSEMLEHIAREDHQSFMRRTHALLKEGGYLILTIPNKLVALSPEAWIDKESLIKLAKPFYNIIAIGSTYFLPSFLSRHKPLSLVYRAFYNRLGCYKIIDRLLSSTLYGLSLVIVGRKYSWSDGMKKTHRWARNRSTSKR
jgi:SAM-dependent methyltransferase